MSDKTWLRRDEWMGYGLCVPEDGSPDVAWITEPDEIAERRLARVCSRCPVIVECYRFHEEHDAVEVFAAGEWREAPEVDWGSNGVD